MGAVTEEVWVSSLKLGIFLIIASTFAIFCHVSWHWGSQNRLPFPPLDPIWGLRAAQGCTGLAQGSSGLTVGSPLLPTRYTWAAWFLISWVASYGIRRVRKKSVLLGWDQKLCRSRTPESSPSRRVTSHCYTHMGPESLDTLPSTGFMLYGTISTLVKGYS